MYVFTSNISSFSKRRIGHVLFPCFFLITLTSCVGLNLPRGSTVPNAAQQSTGEFIAMSEVKMSWPDAKAWCEQQGGRLPLIGGDESSAAAPKGIPIDGFGSNLGPWPSNLPGDNYWTGTESLLSTRFNVSWAVDKQGNMIRAHTIFEQRSKLGVVCVK